MSVISPLFLVVHNCSWLFVLILDYIGGLINILARSYRGLFAEQLCRIAKDYGVIDSTMANYFLYTCCLIIFGGKHTKLHKLFIYKRL